MTAEFVFVSAITQTRRGRKVKCRGYCSLDSRTMMEREPPRKEMNDDRRKVSTSRRDKGAQQGKFQEKESSKSMKGG